MNYFELKNQFEKLFDSAKIEEKADIDWIMVEVTGKQRSMLKFHDFSNLEIEKISWLISKRVKHIPLAYITNKAYFYGRDFYVNENTLIPRQDTEILIETILPYIKNSKKNLSVLDIGTGSGIIAIILEQETNANVIAVDISEKALEVAKINAHNLNSSVKFIHSNLFEAIDDFKFDIIVSNPPYIKTNVIEELEPEVKFNEPKLALDGGIDGLDYYRKIIINAKNYLNKNGMLFFEIGYDQANYIKKIMSENFENIMVLKDYSGNDRVVFGKLRG